MKVTKQYLQKLIKEEIARSIKEDNSYGNDALEGVRVDIDYDDPHGTEWKAQEMWEKFISNGVKPDGQQFKNPKEAQATFLRKFMTSWPKNIPPDVRARAQQLGDEHKKFMSSK